MQAVPAGIWEQAGQGGEEPRRERVRISLPSMVVENRLQYSLMTNNSDGERASTSPEAVARKGRFVWWAGSVAVLIGLAVLATWLAYRSNSFSAVRQRCNALQQSPAPSWLLPLGLAVIALLAIFILWKLPQWQVAQVRSLEPKERFDRVNEARKTLATILGGIVLLAGFFGTWRNLQLTQKFEGLAGRPNYRPLHQGD